MKEEMTHGTESVENTAATWEKVWFLVEERRRMNQKDFFCY